MAVAFVDGNGAAGQLVSSLDTGTLTIGAEENKVLVAGVSFNTSSNTLSTVVWDPTGVNEPLAEFGTTYVVGNRKIAMFYAIAPSAATGIVRATWSGSSIGSQAVIAACFSGAHQTTPLTDSTTDTGSSSNASVAAITAATDEDMLFDAFMGVFEPTHDAGQTSVFLAAGGDWHGSSYQDGATAGDVMSWTAVGGPGTWLLRAVRIAEGTPPPPSTGGIVFNLQVG